MKRTLLLSPSLLGLAASLTGAMHSPGRAARPLLSPGEMKATRGGTQGGTCNVAICNRPNGSPDCYISYDPVYSRHTFYHPGWDCTGGTGSCSAQQNIWCYNTKFYNDVSPGCTDFAFDAITYGDRCS